MKSPTLLSILLLQATAAAAQALSITGGNCRKNVSVKYQVPVARTRVSPLPPLPLYDTNELLASSAQQYVDFEERTRWDTVRICCAGYRDVLFGFCAPICTQPCPPLSYCAAPDKCACLYGYAASHLTQRHQQLLCRPTCQHGCPKHSYCAAHNRCKCRPAYKDTSRWFHSVRCERMHCPPKRHYDVLRAMCMPSALAAGGMEQLVSQESEEQWSPEAGV